MNKRFFLGLSVALLALLLMTTNLPAQASPVAQLTVFPTPTPGPDGKIIYIVQTGDTLWRISAITNVSIEQLRTLNKLGPDDPIKPGDKLVIGFAGPSAVEPTPGASPTPPPQLPTGSAQPGWGVLCILLYNDLNGDALRQEEEPSIPEGAISVGDRLGKVSLTADTPSGGVTDEFFPTPEELGYTCFEELPEGEYNVTVAVPEGYNPTTILNQIVNLFAGDETYLAFGAQANIETLEETAIIPESPRKSPVLGLLGGLMLLLGVGLGLYAAVLRRTAR